MRPFGAFGVRIIDVKIPSAANIISLTDPLGRPRFEADPPFILPTRSVKASPSKRRKLDEDDFEIRWRTARSEMIEEKQRDEDDGLPPVEFAFSSSSINASTSTFTPVEKEKEIKIKRGKSKGRTTSKVRRRNVDDSASGEDVGLNTSSRFSPPPPDVLLEIPGELVLARVKKNELQYWPAKVLEYIPPKHAKDHSKYAVLFCDSTTAEIPRELFFVYDDDGFHSCKVSLLFLVFIVLGIFISFIFPCTAWKIQQRVYR